MRAWFVVLVPALAVLGCRREPSGAAPAPSASSTPARADDAWALELLRAEHDRDADAVPLAALTAPQSRVRLATTRALARIGDARARPRLLEALADERAEVVRWAAFGLGHACAGSEDSVVRALVIRALGIAPGAAAHDAALAAIARALGRCANDEAERTLRAWLRLEPPLARAAALALGSVAARHGKLSDPSAAALLELAAGGGVAAEPSLFAFGRSRPPEGPLGQRLLELATRDSGDETARRYALRALGRTGPFAVPALRALVERDDVSAAERAEAVRELSRLGGAAAQHALAELLPVRLAAQGAELTRPPELGTLLALLEALETGATARPALERLSRLPLPDRDPQRRHTIQLRCAAAQLLAGRASLASDLVACDPDPNGRTGKLAVLSVLGRGELTGARARRHRQLAEDPDPVVRQRAVALLSHHPAAEQAAAILERALGDDAPGPLTTAAELLGEHPERARPSGAAAPRPELIERLATSYRLWQKRPNLAVRAALIDAARALGVLSLKGEIARDCVSDAPELRRRAERALQTFGERGRRCERAPGAAPPPEELARLARRRTRLRFETDAGELFIELEPELAPVAVTRVVELAASGFFDGMSVHRVVPGFVVQFGDPGGDGYGGVERRALRSELGPEEFEPGAVGLALSGPDTASSQLFVTLGRYPHLDGEYTKLGRAGPGWERLVFGDRLRRVRPVP